jgi:hypothetical protein
VVIANGVSRQIQVTFDPINETLMTKPIIGSGDLLRDTKIACSLGEISPVEACEVLADLASEIEDAIAKDNKRVESVELKLYLSILHRLHKWGESGSRQNWTDLNDCSECAPLCKKGTERDEFFAKDPSYSALELDVDTLLKELSKVDKNSGR